MAQRESAAAGLATLSDVPGTELRELHASFASFRDFVDRYSSWLSDTNIFVESSDLVPDGAPVRLEFRLEDQPITLIRALGEVEWVRPPAAAGPEEPPGAAVKITYLDQASARLIESIFRLYTEQEGAPLNEDATENWEFDVESLIDQAFPGDAAASAEASAARSSRASTPSETDSPKAAPPVAAQASEPTKPTGQDTAKTQAVELPPGIVVVGSPKPAPAAEPPRAESAGPTSDGALAAGTVAAGAAAAGAIAAGAASASSTQLPIPEVGAATVRLPMVPATEPATEDAVTEPQEPAPEQDSPPHEARSLEDTRPAEVEAPSGLDDTRPAEAEAEAGLDDTRPTEDAALLPEIDLDEDEEWEMQVDAAFSEAESSTEIEAPEPVPEPAPTSSFGFGLVESPPSSEPLDTAPASPLAASEPPAREFGGALDAESHASDPGSQTTAAGSQTTATGSQTTAAGSQTTAAGSQTTAAEALETDTGAFVPPEPADTRLDSLAIDLGQTEPPNESSLPVSPEIASGPALGESVAMSTSEPESSFLRRSTVLFLLAIGIGAALFFVLRDQLPFMSAPPAVTAELPPTESEAPTGDASAQPPTQDSDQPTAVEPAETSETSDEGTEPAETTAGGEGSDSEPSAATQPAAEIGEAPAATPSTATEIASTEEAESEPAEREPAAESPAGANTTAVIAEVERQVRAWAVAWSEQNPEDFIACYAADYSPSGLTREQWEAQRRVRIRAPAQIHVQTRELDVKVLDASTAEATFHQEYETDTKHLFTWKTMRLERQSEGWRIVSERKGQ
ncbi:MAG: hypothetical protein AAF560_11045 [Acidobacteriota bacterium]